MANRARTKFKLTSTLMRVVSLVAIGFAAPIVVRGETSTRNATLDVSHIGDATHLEFSGLSDWKYTLRRDPKSVALLHLQIPSLTPDAATKLRTLHDTLVDKVQVSDQGADNSYEITIALGAHADYFDYLTDQPSRLIIDFFPPEDDGAAAAPTKAAAKPFSIKPPTVKAVTGKKAAPVVAKAEDVASEDDADDQEDADEMDPVARATRTLPGKHLGRRPAGSDVPLKAKSELPPAPSLAEEISSRKDFSHGIFDGGDPEFHRFSIRDYEVKDEAINASRGNYYIPFPMLDLGNPQLRAMLKTPPTYEIVANDTRENKEARILLSLFSKGQRALFLKTAKDFLEEHPESKYDEIVRYMVADAHYDIWRGSNSSNDFETAMNSYLALAEKYADSPMTPRTLLLLGYSYLDRDDSFGALKTFTRFARQYPKSKHIDRVNIAIAEANIMLNRFDDAYAMLDQVEKKGQTMRGREEAAFRKGDIAFRRKNFAEAVAEYDGAGKRYPTVANEFPNAWFNRAEAQFLQKKYRDSLEAYRLFLQKFPDHEHGGYAMTRMGELLGILGADEKRAQGAFLESFFRYRATPGAGIARLRLLTSRIPAMKDKELESALLEIADITSKYANRPKSKKQVEEEKAAEVAAAELASKEAAKGAGEHKKEAAKPAPKEGEGGEGAKAEAHAAPAVHEAEPEPDPNDPSGIVRFIPKEGEDLTRRKPELPGIEEFTALLISDAFNARHDYDKAAADLISYYQKNPQSPNQDKFKARIVRNISDGIREEVDNGRFIEGLRRFSKSADGWLKNTDRVDVPYEVGRAYEQAGVFKEAATAYQDCLKRLQAIKVGKLEREHEIFETLPKADAVKLRLAAVAGKEKEFARAESLLKSIPTPGSLTEREQIERAEVSADVAEARGQTESARKYLGELLKAWQGEPQLTGPLHLRLAKLEIAKRNFAAADQHLAKILAWKNQDGSVITDDLHARALELHADNLIARGKRADAVKAYRELLTAYEDKRPLASVRYRLGQVLFEDSELKEAEAVWNELKPGKENLWQRLATEQMQGAKWRKEYKKYLERIPAAADMRTPTASK